MLKRSIGICLSLLLSFVCISTTLQADEIEEVNNEDVVETTQQEDTPQVEEVISEDDKQVKTMDEVKDHLSPSVELLVGKIKPTALLSGTWGQSDWSFESTTGVLTLKAGTWGTELDAPWRISTPIINKNDIKKIIIEPGAIANEACNGLFRDLYNLVEIEGGTNLDTSNVNTMDSMFTNNRSLEILDVSNWDTSKVAGMNWMFYDNSKLKNLDVSGWNTSSVDGMGNMFVGASGLTTLDVSKWDTSNVKNMIGMFNDTGLTALDVSEWDTSSVEDMDYMFYKSSSLEELDLSKWNTNNVDNDYMRNMFGNCVNLKKLALGADFKFKLGYNPNLPNITPDANYTGKWKAINSGNVWTSSELMNNHNGLNAEEIYVWQTNAFKVTYNDEDTLIKELENEDFELNQVVSVDDLSYIKPGFIFDGWNTAKDGSGTDYNIGDTVSADVTLYAQWIERVAAITTDKTTYEVGETVTLDGSGYEPTVKAIATLHSTPIKVGEYAVTTSGTFASSFIIPKDMKAGVHTLKVSDGVHTAEVKLTITVPTPKASTSPKTGDTTQTSIYVASLLVSLGMLVFIVRKRKEA